MKAIVKKKYKKNFLDKVILQINFASNELEKLTEYSKEIEHSFPIQKTRQEDGFEVIVDGKNKNVQQSFSKKNIWRYEDVRGQKVIQISSDYFVLEFNKGAYENMQSLEKDIENFVLPFLDKTKIDTVNRVGLRYINMINLNNLKIENFKWSKFISSKLVSSLGTRVFPKEKLLRKIEKVELGFEEFQVNIIHGIPNGDYPAVSKRKEYILDFDAFSKFPVNCENNNLLQVVKVFNKKIESLFENSITPTLRDLMNK